MPINEDLFSRWAQEVKDELKERRDEVMQNKLEIMRLATEVRIRNKILWALVGTIIACAGVIVAILALQR